MRSRASTGDTALYADWNGTAVSGMGSLGLGHTALSLAGLNWDGDTALDFVFDDGTGLWKKLGTGTPAARIGSVSNYAQPRVLRLPGPFGGGTDAEFDRVIWLTQSDAGPGQMLKVVSSPMGTSEQPIYGGNITAAHLTLADFDADGSEDLLITRSDEHTAFVLFQQHAGSMSLGFFSELTHNALGWDLGAVSGSSPGSPAVGAGDLDGDGDADVLYAGQPGSADVAQVCFANSIDEEEGVGSLVSTVKHVKPWLTYATYVDWMYPHTPPEDDPDEAQLTLEQWTGVVDSAVISANYVRVTVWGRMDDTSDISPVCLQDWFEDCSSSHFTVPIPLPPNPEAGLPQYLVIQVSYVVCDGAPEADHVVQAFPAWTGQFDHTLGIGHPPSAGGGTTGGIDRPPPPPSGTPPSP
jgi:hypothetical protein